MDRTPKKKIPSELLFELIRALRFNTRWISIRVSALFDHFLLKNQRFKFGPLQIDRIQCFWRTPNCFAFVIPKPLVPGHVLVSPLRTATRLTELSDEETCYLFVMAKHVQKMLESIYGIGKVTQFIVEDEGPHAVQAVKYVHVHVLPRMDNDFGNNLDLAVLQGREGQGEARSVDEMESEATRYRQWLQKKSDEGWNE